MLYSSKDLKSVQIQLAVTSIIDVVVIIFGIIYGYKIAMDSNQFLGTVILTAALVLFVFILGNFVLPCLHYYKYLMDVFMGKYTKRAGTISTISPKPVYKDNKNYYYEVDVNFDGTLCGMLLYDANLGKPEFAVGDEKSFICHENFIVKIEK